MAKDPYKYFRIEARELIEGLGQGVLALEREAPPPDLVPRLLRLAHTLKGAARVVKVPRIAELAHAVEEVLAPRREVATALPPEDAAELLRLIDAMTAGLRGLAAVDEPAAMTPATTTPAASASTFTAAADEPSTVRVEIDEVDALLRGLVQGGVELGGARRELDELDRIDELTAAVADQLARAGGAKPRAAVDELRSRIGRLRRGLGAGLDRLDAELGLARDAAQRLRLVPVRTIFPALDRAVRDAAQALGRRVALRVDGGELRLDAPVLAALRDALLHVVRNAVAHGLEPEAARLAAGKPAVGAVHVAIARTGGRVTLTCRDDGRGFDLDAIRAAAIARGAAAPAGDADALRLLLDGGLSTTDHVTELAGRGIGLDVVRATVVRLGGTVQIDSSPGRGAAVVLDVPASIASIAALLVEAGGVIAAIPLDTVHRTLRVDDADLVRAGGRGAVLDGGELIPFLPIGRALRQPEPPRPPRSWSVVVIGLGARRVAIGVARLLGTATVVVRALPAVAAASPVIAGAALDPEGTPQLVLDPAALIAAAEDTPGVDAEARPARLPVLVVDDSLTTRMLEQSILESAGYEVDTATSAEEGLVRARSRRYGLMLVDVEMPGMDGFEMVRQTRADPQLREVPAILVTSRNAPEDRRRGAEVGAHAYIVKSEFDQRRLLQIISAVVG